MHEALEAILTVKREEMARQKIHGVTVPFPYPDAAAPRDFKAALTAPGITAIAEIKRRSPSQGTIRAHADPARIARDYEAHGAGVLSVLTDGTFFGGSTADLQRARRAVSLPVLRKDFVIDPYQLLETRLMGADAVLLIVRILGREQLGDLLYLSRELDLGALVEVHNERELLLAVDLGAEIIGVNNRNLDTFEVDSETAFRLIPAIPKDRIAVAESGIRDPVEVARLEESGFDAVLVGESLMRARQPGPALARLLGATTGGAKR